MASQSLTAYVAELYGGEDNTLLGMRAEAEEKGLPAIQVSFELGRLLQVLVMQSKARRVLEIGTLFGYSTVLMARSLPADGSITTLEVAPKHANLATSNFQRAGVASKVSIIVGPALESLVELREAPFDFVFIDADKGAYPRYLEHALRLTTPGSTIVADNVWRNGSVLSPSEGDVDSDGIAVFNKLVASNPRLLTSVIPTRDGRDGTSVSVVLP